MKLFKTYSRHTFRRIARLALAGLLLLSISLLFASAQAGNAAAGKDPLWGASVKNAPAWLKMADSPSQLYSEYPFAGLAGHLIANRAVDATGCGGNGLRTDGTANKCGIERAFPALLEWQNRLNASIVATSDQTGVPPILLKNIFAWESQFWPQTIYVNTYEYGLGHITEMGADSALRWNVPFYDQICAASFSKVTCQKDYSDQPENIRIALRGVVIQQVKADCSGCSYGLDMPLAERSIPIFAQTLLANASFVKWYIGGLTGHPAAESVKYEDLWKFTLTSYNAGPGCFMTAFSRTMGAGLTLDWKNLSSQLDPGCAGSKVYVDYVSKNNYYNPAHDPSLLAPTPTETVTVPTATETPASLSPEPTATPTSTLLASSLTADLSATALNTQDSSASPTPTVSSLDATGTAQVLPTDLSTPFATAPSADNGTVTAIPMGTVSATLTQAATATSTDTAQPTATTESLSAQLESPHVTNEVLVKINPANRQAAFDTIMSLGISLKLDSSTIESLDTLIIQVEPAQLEPILAALKASPGVEFAEPNYTAALASTPNDTDFPVQDYLTAIQVPQAWDSLPSLQGVLVAVVDTGVDINHPDLRDAIWQNPGEIGQDTNGHDKRFNGIDDDNNGYVDDWQGWNMVAGNNKPVDDQGHGTHLAGIIGATSNNGIGIAGIAPNARILPVKVLDNNGYGTYAQVAEGIVYATDQGARVINLGFGGTGSSELLQNAIDYAVAHNAIVVASAGNSGDNTLYYPAAYPGVLAISASDNNGYWSSFSSFGNHISLAAPGVGIYSTTIGGGYRTKSGTSMSAAMVSGVAALLAGKPEFADSNFLRSSLLNGALDRGNAGRDQYFGYGVVQALGSLGYAGPVLPTPTPWAAPTSYPGGSGGVYGMATMDMYATGQNFPVTACPRTNSAGSIDVGGPLPNPPFNGNTANVTCSWGGMVTDWWQFKTFLPATTYTSPVRVELDIRMSVDPSTYVDDTYEIQVRQGSFWYPVAHLVPSLSAAPTLPEFIMPTSGLSEMVIDVSSYLNTMSNVNTALVRINGFSTGSNSISETVAISVDGVRLRTFDTLPTPTPTLVFIPTVDITRTPRAITATPQVNEPHNNMENANIDLCAGCHSTHTAKSINLRSVAGEEQVCFACHTSGGSGTNVQPAFTLKTNTATRFFSHGVATSLDIHQLPAEETTGERFGGVNRHVECEDCHTPHSSSRTMSAIKNPAPLVQQEMFNTTGVDPTWDKVGAPASFAFMPQAQREYQICFKCHSSFTSLPTYSPDGFGWAQGTFSGTPVPFYISNGLAKLDNNSGSQISDKRDLSAEFNSFQASYHPVAAIGRNRSIPSGSFVSGWSINSMVFCSDCHTNASAPTNGSGPHGSPNLHILDGSSEYITKPDPNYSCTVVDGDCISIHNSGELCFKCHQYKSYSRDVTQNSIVTTNFRRGNTENLHVFHSFAACYTCHDTHGSEQDRLINFDTSVAVPLPTYNSQSAWQKNGSTGTCYIACHGAQHGPPMQYDSVP